MHRLLGLSVVLSAALGCAAPPAWTGPGRPGPIVLHHNPVLVPASSPEHVWQQVVDVVDDYFRIEREEPIRLVGNILTEGRLDTFPSVGSTLLEPWHNDSADYYQRLESTLQSIRRRAVVRVLPAERGYWVDVVVLKELEDVARPERATAGAATFRHDGSLSRVVNPLGDQPAEKDWIHLGRDIALEQRLIGQLLGRTGTPVCR